MIVTSDNKTKKPDPEFEKYVSEYLKEHGITRKKKLVEALQNSHSDKKGYSKPNINHQLGYMFDNNKLDRLKPDEVLYYGINENDGRARYLILPEMKNLQSHMNKVIQYLKSKEQEDIETALEELKLYKEKYILTEHQLDALVQKLDAKDEQLSFALLEILYDHVVNKGIEPQDKEKFRNQLYSLLPEMGKSSEDYLESKKYIIKLLGFYKDKKVIEQLEKDIESEKNLSSIESYYKSELTAQVIDIYKTEILELRTRFKKEGKKEAAKSVFNIRKQAMDCLDKAKK